MCEFVFNSGLRVIGFGVDGCLLVWLYYLIKCLIIDLMCILFDLYVFIGGVFKYIIYWNE